MAIVSFDVELGGIDPSSMPRSQMSSSEANRLTNGSLRVSLCATAWSVCEHRGPHSLAVKMLTTQSYFANESLWRLQFNVCTLCGPGPTP
jgi:hypothetical protein